MSEFTPQRFRQQADDALHDEVLRSALRRATGLFGDRRKAAIAEVPEWEALRERGRVIKENVLFHLDRYLEQFESNARRQGIQVHWARDAKEACDLIVDLAASAGARTVVKSKSMTTEEVHLNAALERAEIDPVETDLGEWIIQLAGEVPSHIIVPAIHKTKAQIAELFTEKVGLAPTDDEKKLTECARGILRSCFVTADVGISGANFCIAETGSILLVENEGNIRMTTSLPRVHIALAGIEKVIPTIDDLAVFLRLLPRSGTGQHLTTYQSLISGPRRTGDEEGPEEVHIVLLDNGRSAMLREHVTRQSLACIRCGACLNACPVYQQIGGHAYGSVYPGPIGAVITPQLQGAKKASQLPYASSLCGACREVCPVKIDIPELLLHLRSCIADKSPVPGAPNDIPSRPWPERAGFRVWAWWWSGPKRYALSSWIAGAVMRRPWLRWLLPVGGWTASRDLRTPATRSFRALWRDSLAEERDNDA
ncbi:MAG: iron-sulfur cluster-binding protein [Planctomycetes bacterium]|nr:iron-sulfur cluster-binding protein [Planctomycetota bacterium]